MKVSLRWIEKIIGQELDREKAIDIIGAQLAEVESVISVKDAYKDVVVADIIEARDHPDADKLGVYIVNNGKQDIQVVAGDRSLKVGDKVAHLPVGSIVPVSYETEEPFKLEKRELRGVESNGMLASEQELAFSDEHEGVLALDTEADAGTPFYELYDLDDLVLEIENKTLTHRPDAFGMLGFAREVAAIHGIKFMSPDWYKLGQAFDVPSSVLPLEVKNEAKDLCPRYMAVVLDGVKVGQSSIENKSLLNRLGVRPVNNIVDWSNLYMILTGQPTHFFDYDKLTDNNIIIRKSVKGETIDILDGRTIELEDDSVLICDAKGPIAIGGVMGSTNSEVGADTTRVVLEVANFDMYSIRNTSMRYGIFSEAVTRFSRGQSPEQCLPVTKVLTSVLNEHGANVASEVFDDYTSPEEKLFGYYVEDINSLLGTEYDAGYIASTLENAEIIVDRDSSSITVPFWRMDLNIKEDIAEEIGRLSDFSSIVATLPSRDVKPVSLTPRQELVKSIRQILASAGANELATYSGVSEKLATISSNNKKLYEIRNSRSPDLKFMRSNLLASILSSTHQNHKKGHGDFALFEVGVVHDKDNIVEDSLPLEQGRVAMVYSANTSKSHSAYYDAKLYLEHLLISLGLEGVQFSKLTPTYNGVDSMLLAPRAATIEVGGKKLGVIGEFNTSATKQFKLSDYCAGFEIDLSILEELEKTSSYNRLAKYPEVERDLTYEVSKDIPHIELTTALSTQLDGIDSIGWKLSHIDIYMPEGTNLKRVTYKLKLWHKEKTLDSSEVNAWVDEINKALSNGIGAKQI